VAAGSEGPAADDEVAVDCLQAVGAGDVGQGVGQLVVTDLADPAVVLVLAFQRQATTRVMRLDPLGILNLPIGGQDGYPPPDDKRRVASWSRRSPLGVGVGESVRSYRLDADAGLPDRALRPLRLTWLPAVSVFPAVPAPARSVL
jgi:hypothetical protein